MSHGEQEILVTVDDGIFWMSVVNDTNTVETRGCARYFPWYCHNMDVISYHNWSVIYIYHPPVGVK